MLKLLTCARGHFWEVEEVNGEPTPEAAARAPAVCPTCGGAAEALPDFDLAPSDEAARPAAPPPAAPPPPPPLRDAEGRPVVAGYEILDDKGRTPRGVLVFRARQVLVHRVVLLKVVFGKDDPGQRAWGCLRGEAAALGKLAHPNVVQIFEVGERERLLFYNAVELVDGPTLSEKVQNKALTPRQAAAVIEILARAVHAAHEKGLLHRNLKPASVLVAGKADAPIEDCTLKLTDFGLTGRPVEGDVNDLELQGMLPYYLSPEQALGRVRDFGPATDVWALGAMLYELLTGRPPFVADDWTVLLDKVTGKDYTPPALVQKRVPADLDAVCRRCLVKSPRRRYKTARELADDLRRFRDGYPVQARPVSPVGRLVRWVKRRPAAAVFVLLAALALVAVLTAYRTSTGDPKALEAAKQREQRTAREAEGLRVYLDQVRAQKTETENMRLILLAEKQLGAGNVQSAMATLNECPVEARRWEWYYLGSADPAHAKEFVPQVTTLLANKPVSCVAYSVDGLHIAAGTDRGDDKKSEVRVWAWPGNRQVYREALDGPIEAVALRPLDLMALPIDGKVLVAAAVSRVGPKDRGQLVIGSVPPGAAGFTIDVPDARVTDLAYSPDQEYLAVGRDDGRIALYRADDGASGPMVPITFGARPGQANRVRLAFSTDGQRLAACNQSNAEVHIWNRGQRQTSSTSQFLNDRSRCLAYGPEDRLAVGGGDGFVAVLDSSLFAGRSWRGHPAAVNAVAFTHDGKRLATAGDDKTVRIWDPATATEILTLKDFASPPTGLAFSADGRRLAVAVGNEVRLYGSEHP